MRIQRLHVHNFKALEDVEFILEASCNNRNTCGEHKKDDYELKNARKAVYHTLVSMSQYMSKEQIAMVYEQSTEEYVPFRNVVTWYLNSLEA